MKKKTEITAETHAALTRTQIRVLDSMPPGQWMSPPPKAHTPLIVKLQGLGYLEAIAVERPTSFSDLEKEAGFVNARALTFDPAVHYRCTFVKKIDDSYENTEANRIALLENQVRVLTERLNAGNSEEK